MPERAGRRREGRPPRRRFLRAGARVLAGRARGERPVYFGADTGFLPTQVIPRETVAPGETLHGPALIELGDATVTIGPGAQAVMQDDGLIRIALTY